MMIRLTTVFFAVAGFVCVSSSQTFAAEPKPGAESPLALIVDMQSALRKADAATLRLLCHQTNAEEELAATAMATLLVMRPKIQAMRAAGLKKYGESFLPSYANVEKMMMPTSREPFPLLQDSVQIKSEGNDAVACFGAPEDLVEANTRFSGMPMRRIGNRWYFVEHKRIESMPAFVQLHEKLDVQSKFLDAAIVAIQNADSLKAYTEAIESRVNRLTNAKVDWDD